MKCLACPQSSIQLITLPLPKSLVLFGVWTIDHLYSLLSVLTASPEQFSVSIQTSH